MTLPDGPIVVASFSHSGLAHVLQSLPLERGWSGTLQTIMNGRPPARHLIPLTVAGEERITVPAGSFECWRLEVAGDRDIRMWISKGEQLLVKTSSGSEGYELETVLLSYAPSSG